MLVLHLDADDSVRDGFRNAIFNGDMGHGLAAWKTIVGKDENAKLESVSKDIIDIRTNLLSLAKEGEAKWWLYNERPIKIRAGQKYHMSLRASGQGKVQLGVFENNSGFLKNSVSSFFDLSGEVRIFHYDYLPQKDVKEVRPAMYFQSQSGKLDASIYLVSLEVSENDFSSATDWPKTVEDVRSTEQRLQEQITKFKDYKGITDVEEREILDEVKVKGVLPPFSPIEKICKDKYKLTLAEFDFNGTVFPKSIRINGVEVLALPIELKMDIAGITAPQALPASYDHSPERVVITQVFLYGKCRVNIQCELSYDALMIYTVSIDSTQGKEILSAGLILSIKKDIAKYFRFTAIKFSGDLKQDYYFMNGFGPVPARGEKFRGKYSVLNGRWKNEWQPVESDAAEALLWSCKDFMPAFWTGNEEIGLGFVCESEQGWSRTPDADVFMMKRNVDSIEDRMNFITAPAALDCKRELVFGLQAMPAKNPNSNWFKVSLDHEPQFRLKDNYIKAGMPPVSNQHSLKNNLVSLWYTFWSKGCGTPSVANPQVMTEFIKGCQYYDYEPLIYLTPTHLSLLTQEGVFYGPLTKKWSVFPEQYYFVPRQEIVNLCPASFMSEYQACEIGKLIDKYGIRGIYFDNANARPCFSSFHGCAYKNDKGQTCSRVPIFAIRKFFMMVRNQFVKRGISPQIVIHAGFFPGEISFIDYELNGEGVYALDYSDILSMEEMRALMIGPNQYGCGFIFLPQFSYLKDKKSAFKIKPARTLLAFMLPHGTKLWATFCNRIPVCQANRVFNMLEDSPITFLPYWKWHDVNSNLNKMEIYATMYAQEDKALLAVSNLSAQNREVTIERTMLEKALEKHIDSVSDPMDNRDVGLDAEKLTLKIEEKDFRLIMFHMSSTPKKTDREE